MAKDPAFLFYPGDYLRDTQCLSERAQVAYDRIMCEHMRNICITQANLNFFTKRLSDEEKKEIFHILTKIDGGYQIDWVAESIVKRQAYSDSRRSNRLKKDEDNSDNISSSHDSHMENENENENNTGKRTRKKSANKKTTSTAPPFNTMPKQADFKELPEQYITSAIGVVRLKSQITITPDTVKGLWDIFKIQNLTGGNYYPNEGRVYSHFINVIKKENFTKDGASKGHGANSNRGSGRYQPKGEGGY